MSDLPITVREYRDTDKPFILDSWVNTICYGSPANFWVPTNIRKSIYRNITEKLLNASPELFKVLVREDDLDQIFAWVCREANVIHFVYVKEEFRRERLATLLVPELIEGKVAFSHWTLVCERLSNAEYIPSLFRRLVNAVKN